MSYCANDTNTHVFTGTHRKTSSLRLRRQAIIKPPVETLAAELRVFPGVHVIEFSARFSTYWTYALSHGLTWRASPDLSQCVVFYFCQSAATHLPIWISHSPPRHGLTEVLLMQLHNRLNIDEHYSDSMPKGIQASSQEKRLYDTKRCRYVGKWLNSEICGGTAFSFNVKAQS